MAQLLAFEACKFMKNNVAMRVRQREHWFALVVQRDIVYKLMDGSNAKIHAFFSASIGLRSRCLVILLTPVPSPADVL